MSPTRPYARSTPRKAPKQARSLETVTAIVEAAARILEADGNDGFSTNAVAERAGVSVGSLYQYFPSKDALIGALIVRETSLLVGGAEVAAAKHDGRVALIDFIAVCISHQFHRPRLARLLDFEEARLPFDPETQRVGDRVHRLVGEMLGKANLPVQTDINAATRDLVAIIKGIVDAAGQYGEDDQAKLARRVRCATFGYLYATST